jgi:hypothetical protein
MLAAYFLANLGGNRSAPLQQGPGHCPDEEVANGPRRNPGVCNPVFDALVRLGWARDDSEKNMEQAVLPVVVDRRRSAAVKTSVTIEQLA